MQRSLGESLEDGDRLLETTEVPLQDRPIGIFLIELFDQNLHLAQDLSLLLEEFTEFGPLGCIADR